MVNRIKQIFNINNKIIVHNTNGTLRYVKNYPGIAIKFRGENNIVEIWEPCKFTKHFWNKRSKIDIDGNNNHIVIQNTQYRLNSIRVIGMNNNCKLIIGKNIYQTGSLLIDYTCIDNLSVQIGNDCMFGYRVNLMCGDYHTVYNEETKEILNYPQKGIIIGNHVWLAKNTTVLKDVEIPDNTIIATGTIVSKTFTKPNTILGGNPVQVLKDGVNWSVKNVHKFTGKNSDNGESINGI